MSVREALKQKTGKVYVFLDKKTKYLPLFFWKAPFRMSVLSYCTYLSRTDLMNECQAELLRVGKDGLHFLGLKLSSICIGPPE